MTGHVYMIGVMSTCENNQYPSLFVVTAVFAPPKDNAGYVKGRCDIPPNGRIVMKGGVTFISSFFFINRGRC